MIDEMEKLIFQSFERERNVYVQEMKLQKKNLINCQMGQQNRLLINKLLYSIKKRVDFKLDNMKEKEIYQYSNYSILNFL